MQKKLAGIVIVALVFAAGLTAGYRIAASDMYTAEQVTAIVDLAQGGTR